MSSTAESSTAGRARDPDAALDLVRLELVAAKEELAKERQRVTNLEQRIAAVEAQALQLQRGLEPDRRHAISRWCRRGGGPRGVMIHKDFDDPLPEFDEP